jgi:hypothetical protein
MYNPKQGKNYEWTNFTNLFLFLIVEYVSYAFFYNNV